MPSRRWSFWHVFFTCTFFSVLLPLGMLLWQAATESLPGRQLRMLRAVHHQILADYVERRSAEDLLYSALEGMVAGLDRHSEFVSPNRVTSFEHEQIEGSYDGIGVMLVPRQVPLRVYWPWPEGPAERAGIAVGDRILAVDGEDVTGPGFDMVAVVAKVKGPIGTRVRLTIGRDGEATRDVEVARGNIPQGKVRWVHRLAEDDGIGYLHVSGFQQHTVREFDSAVEALRAARATPLEGLVLDVRDNPGGLLEEAVALTNRFLRDGVIVTTKSRNAVGKTIRAEPAACTLPDLPVVVLLNGGSASASEVLAGALQDHGRARLVGERSFGKGVVQSIYDWDDGFRLKMTTAHYYTPNGRSIERDMRRHGDAPAAGGLVPDREVALEGGDSRRVRSVVTGAEPPATYREAVAALARELGLREPGPPTVEDDPQLAAALADLRGR
jgi:carboxyl-terminal processing protease